MTALHVDGPTGRYPVWVQRGALANLGALMREAGLSGRAALITNASVGHLYAAPVAASLRQAGLEPVVLEVPDGESFKTLATVSDLYDQLIVQQLDRSSPIVTLGGGVVGDMGGFVAATYLRGVPLVHVPTTLLAMIDSSLGGKVAVDHSRGKNLIGAFYQPRLVAADPNTLSTLPEIEWRAGLAEVIKHGIISAPDLFVQMEAHGAEPLDWIVERAISVKVEVIQEDPFEQGRRAVLNLGHTYGHAFESVSNFRLRHGEAVGIGLVAATRTAVALSLCSPEVEARVIALLRRFGIPTHFSGFPPEIVRAAMNADKKRQSNRLRFVLPQAIGTVTVRDDVPEELILRVIASLEENKP
jgi:3-dehydroquinate synthase